MSRPADVYFLSQPELLTSLNRSGGPFYAAMSTGSTYLHELIDDPALASRTPLASESITSPKRCLLPPEEKLLSIDMRSGAVSGPAAEAPEITVLFARPCDVHAIMRLDDVLLGDFKDEGYAARRRATTIVCLECASAGLNCFCSSLGTGPGFRPDRGCDLVLTPLEKGYLARALTGRGRDLLPPGAKGAPAAALEESFELQKQAETSFTRRLNTDGLAENLLANQSHPIFEREAATRCLNCSNCVMVCPTCFCYEVEDVADPDGGRVDRTRRWDACQDRHFAMVHGANFRSSRKARLRQFVTHKLANWVEQFGNFGCVGCGRCIAWCPTGIDITKMAAEVNEAPV